MATLSGLVDALEDAAQRARDLSAPLDEFGGTLLRAAAPRSPRRTGLLAGSVRAKATAGLLELTSTARYFAPVHNGRKRRGIVKPRTWVLDTLKAEQRQAHTQLEAHVLEPLERL